jgi:cation transport ATPase
MWRFITLLVIVFMAMSFINVPRKKEKIVIHTSAVCDQCQTRIESALLGQRGIYAAILDLATKDLTVTYNPDKINPEQLRTFISNLGYDADNVPRNMAAFDHLPTCCKSHESH